MIGSCLKSYGLAGAYVTESDKTLANPRFIFVVQVKDKGGIGDRLAP
jgi:hypothetical protein